MTNDELLRRLRDLEADLRVRAALPDGDYASGYDAGCGHAADALEELLDTVVALEEDNA